MRLIAVAALCALVGPVCTLRAQTRPTTAPPACQSSPEYRQMDFWAGTWDTSPWSAPAGTKAGSNTILPLLDGCLLLENYSDESHEGKSFSYFDPATKHWRQVRIDQAGMISDVTGEYREGALRLSGAGVEPGGAKVLRRMTLTSISADVVRQLWERSTDDGKTWTVTSDTRYARSQ